MEKPKSNKTKIIIIVIAVIIVIAALAIVLPLSLKKNSKTIKNILNVDKRILNYYPENYISKYYSIVEKSNKFQILEKIIVLCYKSPCNPYTNDTKEIKDKEEIKNLTSFFDQMFNNSVKEKRIEEKELIDEQKEAINTIFKKNGIIFDSFKYEILNNTSDYDSKYSKRGYYFEEVNNSVILTIAMGMKKSGGYSIKIKNVKIGIESDYGSISVEEASPGAEQPVTEAITYPCAKIKFSKKIHYLVIINDETNEVFHEVEANLVQQIRI